MESVPEHMSSYDVWKYFLSKYVEDATGIARSWFGEEEVTTDNFYLETNYIAEQIRNLTLLPSPPDNVSETHMPAITATPKSHESSQTLPQSPNAMPPKTFIDYYGRPNPLSVWLVNHRYPYPIPACEYVDYYRDAFLRDHFKDSKDTKILSPSLLFEDMDVLMELVKVAIGNQTSDTNAESSKKRKITKPNPKYYSFSLDQTQVYFNLMKKSAKTLNYHNLVGVHMMLPSKIADLEHLDKPTPLYQFIPVENHFQILCCNKSWAIVQLLALMVAWEKNEDIPCGTISILY